VNFERTWTAVFDEVPDFRAELVGSSVVKGTAWTQWRWTGMRKDGAPYGMAGVLVLDVMKGKIVRGRGFMEPTVPPAPGEPERAALSDVTTRVPELDYPRVMRIWVLHDA